MDWLFLILLVWIMLEHVWVSIKKKMEGNVLTKPTEDQVHAFTCNHCGTHALEEILGDVTQSTVINDVTIEDGEITFEYGDKLNEAGILERYQCMACGHVIAETEDELIAYLS